MPSHLSYVRKILNEYDKKGKFKQSSQHDPTYCAYSNLLVAALSIGHSRRKIHQKLRTSFLELLRRQIGFDSKILIKVFQAGPSIRI